MKHKIQNIEKKYDFSQKYGGEHSYELKSTGEFKSFTPTKVKVQPFKLRKNLKIQPIQPMMVPLTFQHYEKPPRVPIELNPDLITLPVESCHDWQRIMRWPAQDQFQCRKCGMQAMRHAGIRPPPKMAPDCDSAVLYQVLST